MKKNERSICLGTSVGGVKLSCCVYNASGPRTGSDAALLKIGRSHAGAVLSKSATLIAQDGNALPRYEMLEIGDGFRGSINSEGLPNKGIDYYLESSLVDSIVATGVPYFVSLSGLSLADNLEMLGRVLVTEGVAGVELNLACPNIPGKPIIAYDFEQMEVALRAVTGHPLFGAAGKPLGVKLPPYFDMPHFHAAAEVLNRYPISYVTCCNTVGNGLVVDAETEMALIAPKGGFGGLAGGLIKYTALANVRQFAKLLRDGIDVVGAGGVRSGEDAFELILCGATAVQVGTTHGKEGHCCFERIAGELRDMMERKGYANIHEFRGKLRDHDKAIAKRAKAAKRASSARRGSGSGASSNSSNAVDLRSVLLVALLAAVAFLLAEREGWLAQ